jgi:osmotically-inducible protein OsmY
MAAIYTDTQVRRDVQDEISHDVRIDSTNVTIDVHDGVVRLIGIIPTYFQKVTAGEDAQRIKGVRSVENQLVVSEQTAYSDAEITNNIRANLDRDIRLANPTNVLVTVTRGVVTLTGPVENARQKVDAVDDAWTAPGVVDVIDELRVIPPVAVPDADIRANVEAALRSDPAIDASNVQVAALNGTVYLRGTMPTYYQIQQAGNDAWGVAGVVDVVNELGVSF